MKKEEENMEIEVEEYTARTVNITITGKLAEDIRKIAETYTREAYPDRDVRVPKIFRIIIETNLEEVLESGYALHGENIVATVVEDE